jgi:hypothetical protein
MIQEKLISILAPTLGAFPLRCNSIGNDCEKNSKNILRRRIEWRSFPFKKSHPLPCMESLTNPIDADLDDIGSRRYARIAEYLNAVASLVYFGLTTGRGAISVSLRNLVHMKP